MAVDRANWMSYLSDDTWLSALSIPGTHDSGTYDFPWDPFICHWGKCQDRDITQQLKAGIRFLDIRGRLAVDRVHEMPGYQIVHGAYPMSTLYFYGVFMQCAEFLKAHPKEVIFLSLKREGDPAPDYHYKADFQEVFNLYYQSHYWYTGAPGKNGEHVPTLGDARGKVVLLCRSGMSSNAFGIKLNIPDDCRDATTTTNGVTLHCEDWYSSPDLPGKLKAIMSHLEQAMKGIFDAQAENKLETNLWITFTSANGLLCPADYAKELAPDLTEYLNSGRKRPAGIVPMDFPSDDLIDAIIRTNGF